MSFSKELGVPPDATPFEVKKAFRNGIASIRKRNDLSDSEKERLIASLKRAYEGIRTAQLAGKKTEPSQPPNKRKAVERSSKTTGSQNDTDISLTESGIWADPIGSKAFWLTVRDRTIGESDGPWAIAELLGELLGFSNQDCSASDWIRFGFAVGLSCAARNKELPYILSQEERRNLNATEIAEAMRHSIGTFSADADSPSLDLSTITAAARDSVSNIERHISREPRIAWIGGFIAGIRVDPALAKRASRILSNEGELFSRFARGYLAELVLKKRQYTCAPFADFVRFSYGLPSKESIALHQSCQASLSLCRENQLNLQQFLGTAYRSGRELAESKPSEAMELAVEHREQYLSTVSLFERLFGCPIAEISETSHSDGLRDWISTHPELTTSDSRPGGLKLLRHCYDFMWWLGLACVVGVDLESQAHVSHPETKRPEPATEHEPAESNAREPEAQDSVSSIAGVLLIPLLALVVYYLSDYFTRRTLEPNENDMVETLQTTGKQNHAKSEANAKNVEIDQQDPQTLSAPLESHLKSGKTFPSSTNAGTTQEKIGTAGPVLRVDHDWFYLASRKRPTTLPKVPVANDAAARWKNISAEFRRLQAGRDWFRDTGGSLVRDYFASVTAWQADPDTRHIFQYSSWPVATLKEFEANIELKGQELRKESGNKAGRFTIGSSKEFVVFLHGAPQRLEEHTWTYKGDQTVFFEDERVSGWSAKNAVEPFGHLFFESRTTNDFFTVGSSIGDVARIQGQPTSVKEERLGYDDGELLIHENAVLYWTNTTVTGLKGVLPDTNARSGAPAAPRKDYFTKGSSREDVLKIQGPPAERFFRMRKKEWTYGRSKVFFAGNVVGDWYESPDNPLKAVKIDREKTEMLRRVVKQSWPPPSARAKLPGGSPASTARRAFALSTAFSERADLFGSITNTEIDPAVLFEVKRIEWMYRRLAAAQLKKWEAFSLIHVWQNKTERDEMLKASELLESKSTSDMQSLVPPSGRRVIQILKEASVIETMILGIKHTAGALKSPSPSVPQSAGTNQDPSADRADSASGNSTNENQSEPDEPEPDFYTIDSPSSEVRRLQGEPDKVLRYPALGYEQWRYGSSTVEISTKSGKVLRWSGRGKRLHAKIVPADSATGQEFFTVGSSEDDVAKLNGTPDAIDHYEALGYKQWRYGSATVEISTRSAKVLRWSDRGKKLKKRLVPSGSETANSYFTIGSHQDDVIRLDGTPDSISHYDALGYKEWRYQSSTVEIGIRSRKVIRWADRRGKLQARLIPGPNVTTATEVTVGSHEDDVIRLEGTPFEINDYGALGYKQWRYRKMTIEINIKSQSVTKVELRSVAR